MTALEVRPVRAADEPAVLALHNRAFGPPRWDARRLAWRLHALSPEDLGSPAGASFLGAFEPGGACSAFYGGVRHRLSLDGEAALVLNCADVAVAAELRRGLGGSRLLARMARRHMEEDGGGATRLVYGAPEPALRRVVVRHVPCEVLCDLVLLVHRLGDLSPAPEGLETRAVDAFDAGADALWALCAPEHRAAVVRDRSYLERRFAAHPGVAYELVEARDASGALRGLAALREGGWSEDVAMLSEWVAPREDRDAERALVRHALRFARSRGKRALVALFPAMEPRFTRFQSELGFLAHASPYQLVFRAFERRLDRRWLHEHWYLTLGDVDFF